ncbi:MAG: carbohydrate ABC transporter permease, partial [Actinobacteria bacterium]|nr:carbohydrate ABC transporter permease [Actinomycetota bacterium]
IDGASIFRIFRSIVVPAIRPAAFVLGLFSFLGTWNDFLWPSLVLNDPEKFMRMRDSSACMLMQKAPSRLPSRGSASTHRSRIARRATPARRASWSAVMPSPCAGHGRATRVRRPSSRPRVTRASCRCGARWPCRSAR